MDGQLKIEQMYAFIVMDDDDTEGVPAFQMGDLALPLMGADMAMMERLRPVAQQIANQGKAVTLAVFTNREEVEVLKPERTNGIGDAPSV